MAVDHGVFTEQDDLPGALATTSSMPWAGGLRFKPFPSAWSLTVH